MPPQTHTHIYIYMNTHVSEKTKKKLINFVFISRIIYFMMDELYFF